MSSASFEEILGKCGTLVYKTEGESMRPLLVQGRDVVIISRCNRPLEKYEVPLYRVGEKHYLHRVIGFEEGGYLIRGDNTYRIEHIKKEAVIGVMTGFIRKGKRYSVTDPAYRRYVRLWVAPFYPLRLVLRKCRSALGKLRRRLTGKQK